MDWTDLLGAGMGLAGSYLGYQAGAQPSTTTKTLPPEMMGQWNSATNFANQVANLPYQMGVAPFTQDQYGAMDQIRRQSMGGPEQQAASQAFQNFMQGPQNNPYLKGLVQQTQDDVQNRMGTAAFSSGSFGNSGVGQQTAKALADSQNNLYNQQLNTMASLIPQGLNFQQQNLGNSSALLQSGAMQQQLGQSMLQDYLGYPQKQLQTMMAPLGYAQGSVSSQNGNPWASALGGGLLGLQLGGSLFTPKPATVY